MGSKGHLLKCTGRDSAPTVLVAVGAELVTEDGYDRTGSRPVKVKEIVATYTRRKNLSWARHETRSFGTAPEFWKWLDGLSASGRRVYAVTPRAADTLTSLGFWGRVEAGECRIWPGRNAPSAGGGNSGARRAGKRHPLILSGRPDIIGYSVKGNSYRWCSVTNWAALSLQEIAGRVGYDLSGLPDGYHNWETTTWPAVDVSRVIALYMQSLFDWWIANKCGVWKDTPGAAAWASFLRQGGTNGIIRHYEPDVLKLENRSIFGGRCSAWFFGSIGHPGAWTRWKGSPMPRLASPMIDAPAHRYDVRAMYPSLLRDGTYPTKLLGMRSDLSPAKLASLAAVCEVVADVRVRSGRAEMPRRTPGGAEYPVGQWDTTLTTPEVIDAHRRGEIVSVGRVAFYKRGRPFKAWAEWMLALRDEQARRTDPAGVMIVKTLANSFSGRLARRKCGWKDAPDVWPRTIWGEWTVGRKGEGDVTKYRSIVGHVQELEVEDSRPGTLAAAYAHLTAYGRLMMARVRAHLGPRGVYWQDTDGILIADSARAALESSEWYDPDAYGKLRYERTIEGGRFLTAKHYWQDGRWTLAGIHNGFTVDELMKSTEVLQLNPVRHAVEPLGDAVYRIARTVDLATIDPGIGVGLDAWAIPPEVWKGEKPKPVKWKQSYLWAAGVQGAG